MEPRGRFITLEGLDGCGKSTQMDLLCEHLRRQGWPVMATREPGGTAVGQKVREILLHAEDAITPLTETSLMFAARSQHIEQVLLPALQGGKIVLCDRFIDSSVAYQGAGRGVPLETIRALERLLCRGVRPQLTLLLDIDVATGLQRASKRNQAALLPSTRFERESREFFERVRAGYLDLARQEPQRVRVLDGRLGIGEIHAAICAVVDEFLAVSPGAAGHPGRGGHGV
ncbi:MAG TPA: dTMP kinase [Terriglobia bacterium]|nr:dTMP kinase [Terriglobia bacterium]